MTCAFSVLGTCKHHTALCLCKEKCRLSCWVRVRYSHGPPQANFCLVLKVLNIFDTLLLCDTSFRELISSVFATCSNRKLQSLKIPKILRQIFYPKLLQAKEDTVLTAVIHRKYFGTKGFQCNCAI